MALGDMDIQVLDVIETGGTIDMEGVDSRKPAEGTKKLLTALTKFTPALNIHRPFERPLDSSNIGPDQWRSLLDYVNSLCELKIDKVCSLNAEDQKRALAGIIIAHGTDTLQESSLIMALEFSRIRAPFPIVFTCAYAPSTEPGSDALRNLVLASVIAQSYLLTADKQHVVPPGVYVFVGSEIHLASRIKKVTTRPMNSRSYVESIPAPVGQVTVSHKADLWKLDVSNEVRLRIHNELWRPPVREALISKIPDRKFGYVEHLWFKHDSPPALLSEALIRCHHIGVETNVRIALVLQGDFSRKQGEEIAEIVSELRRFRRGLLQVPVFTGSPKVIKRISEVSGRRNLMFLIPKSLTHSKARTKLSWLLQFDLTPSGVASALRRDLAGECFELPVLPDWIAGESYGPNNNSDRASAKRVVIAHPGISPLVYAEASKSLLESKAKRRELNIVGFGDGNIPLGPITIAGVISRYLKSSYGLDLPVSEFAAFYDIEGELSATIRYDERFRDAILDRYVIQDPKEMARCILSWAKHTAEASDERWTRKVAESLPQLFSEGLGIPHQRLRLALEKNGPLTRAFLNILSKERGGKSYLTDIRYFLLYQGIDVNSLNFDTSGTLEQVGARAVRTIEQWLRQIDRRSLSLLARLLSDVFTRRIMKDAMASAHSVLGCIIKSVDAGVHVNIWTNADMAATDTRKYELGNFLLIAGADSEEVLGWVSGPLRLRD